VTKKRVFQPCHLINEYVSHPADDVCQGEVIVHLERHIHLFQAETQLLKKVFGALTFLPPSLMSLLCHLLKKSVITKNMSMPSILEM
jgi:hypothetical protein